MYGSVKDEIAATLQEIEDAGLYKNERQLTSPQSAHVTTRKADALNFCANNYLGLANEPSVVAAAKTAFEGPWRRMPPWERAALMRKFADLYATYVDALAEVDPDEAQPVWLLKDVIDWKAGFYVDGADAVSFIDTITELAARWNLRIDWGVEDASDEDFLAQAGVPSLMAVAYDRLREYGYSLWTWNAASGPSGDEDMQAGWISLSSDDEAMQELAHALDIELRPGSDPFH